MVNEKVVMDTIKKMKNSGVEDSIIVTTLQDIGLSSEEAQNFLTKIGSVSEPQSVEEPDVVAENTAKKVKEHLDVQAQEHDFRQTQTDVALEQQKQTMNEIHSKIEQLKPVSGETGLKELKDLSKKVDDLKKDISDSNANAKAVKQLMEKVLEANRKILNKL